MEEGFIEEFENRCELTEKLQSWCDLSVFLYYNDILHEVLNFNWLFLKFNYESRPSHTYSSQCLGSFLGTINQNPMIPHNFYKD